MAVVLTGGVSLSVWMGGVVAELQRATLGADGYAVLRALTRTDLTIDVVGGSSAGGINGALLAMALSTGGDLSGVRDLWIDQASLASMLRDPNEPGPAISLLRGDDYFLPKLEEAFAALTKPKFEAASPAVELILTGTLLDGIPRTLSDDFGSTFTDTVHRAEFRFRRDRRRDDFSDPAVVTKLAVAARATSSFPGAFEPTLCRTGTGSADDLGLHVNFPDSRYVIDGGVLVNKPLGPVLDAVIARRDGPRTRRVIAFVQPAPDQEASYGVSEIPGLRRTVGAGLISLPHAESLARELQRLSEHNAHAGRRQLPIQLLHISAESPNGFDARVDPRVKLAGLQMQHFGAFYKSAWRANDWMWGRLDAVARLVQMLLAPARLCALRQSDPGFVEHAASALRDLCAGSGWEDERALRELSGGPEDSVARLDHICSVVTAALQRQVILAEMPNVIERVRADTFAGHTLLSQSAAVLSVVGPEPDDDALLAGFVSCRIGEERVEEDCGSAAYRSLIATLTELGLDLAGRRRRRLPGANPLRGRLATVAPLATPAWAVARRTIAASRWSLYAVAVCLLAGSTLVFSAVAARSAEVASAIVGCGLVLTATAIAGFLAHRVKPMMLAVCVWAVVCVGLAEVGPWAWRTCLVAAGVTDLAVSVRRRIRRGLR
jgi:predicted acylesterase/phospholipase RssA